MEKIEKLIEYYDELFPVKEEKVTFFDNLLKEFQQPAKILTINCGTGLFEQKLAKIGYDITGIEESAELIKRANLRRRTQLMYIRYFQMLYSDISKFLHCGFYNVISITDNKIMCLESREQIKDFFINCKKLLSNNGVLVLELPNFENTSHLSSIKLPVRQSIRTKMISEIHTNSFGDKFLKSVIETGNGNITTIFNNKPVYTLEPEEIEDFAANAGFHRADFYSDYNKNTFTGDEESYIVELK